MSNKEHRLGVSAVNLVVRHLKLNTVDQGVMAAALGEIDQIYGLDGVSFDEKSHVLNLAYDGSRVSLDGVEEMLRKHGISVSHDWWTHLKEGYYRFVDENVKDNARHEPLSCHKVPPGAGRKP
ncbi:MAG: cation transporter [Porticoccaceae bacterium]